MIYTKFSLCSAAVLCVSAISTASLELMPAGKGQVSNPVTFTTYKFFPQIDESVRNGPRRPRNPKKKLPIPVAQPNSLEILTTVPDIGPAVQSKFPGIGATGFEPPDPFIAVGPSHVVQVVNTEIAFFDKTGVKQFQQHLDDTGFFQGVAQTNFVFDPKIIYDSVAKRFIVIAVEQSDAQVNSGLLIGISDDSNPNGTWTKYRINTKVNVSGTNYWFDYPGFGFNKNGLIITGNLFSFGGNQFGLTRSYVVQKAGLLSGGTINFFFFDHNNAFTIQPARCYEGVTNVGYGVRIKNGSTLTFSSWRNMNTTPIYAEKDVTVASFNQMFSYATSTGGGSLDTLGDRMMDTCFRSGYFLCAHTVKVSSTDNRAMVRWYEFQVNSWPTSGAPTRRQGGNIALAAPNHLFMPAIVRNGPGGISILLTRSSPTRTADLYGVSHRSTDPLNKMGPLSFVASSGGSVSSQSRWGDYFCTTVDPSDANRIWACGQVTIPSGNWRTEIAKWLVP